MKKVLFFCSMLIYVIIGCTQGSTSMNNAVQHSTDSIEISTFNFIRTYEGSIGDIPFTMKLTSNDNALSGSYYYDKVGEIVSLKGSISGNDLEVKGFDKKGNLIDEFKGNIIADGSKISGKWSKPDGSKELNFLLLESNKEFSGEERTVDSSPMINSINDFRDLHSYIGQKPTDIGMFDLPFIKSKMEKLFSDFPEYNRYMREGVASSPMQVKDGVLYGEVTGDEALTIFDYFIDTEESNIYLIWQDVIGSTNINEATLREDSRKIPQRVVNAIQSLRPNMETNDSSKSYSKSNNTNGNDLTSQLEEQEKRKGAQNLQIRGFVREKFFTKGLLNKKKSRGYFLEGAIKSNAKIAAFQYPVIEVKFLDSSGGVIGRKEVMLQVRILAGRTVKFEEKIVVPRNMSSYKINIIKVTEAIAPRSR